MVLVVVAVVVVVVDRPAVVETLALYGDGFVFFFARGVRALQDCGLPRSAYSSVEGSLCTKATQRATAVNRSLGGIKR
jgi:hypothetical protein